MPAIYKLKNPQFWLLFIMDIKLDPMKQAKNNSTLPRNMTDTLHNDSWCSLRMTDMLNV
jgi:hypothetical protein